ncbi:P22 phage major capsid protein family protein [Blastococcus sp. BMG 814]|uniref:P22 phage major capsid protein family protein n=1 Tax=Blastococcus carthaginiensis TaxID=3050034 RepID=A0ABT9I9B4_9ACTN|nr:P22 phage major capsid protein family protein [Blastococcus carthaginiensis]MDP5182173.1 P22 phage major capsid protein family protein [Blastococcus carthaginiensis]
MAISNFIPELWNAAVQMPFETALVFGQPSCVNREYEGQIRQMGDTVHVTSIADPTVRKYDKNTDLNTEDLADEDTSMVVDQGDYFSFRVNDVDQVQAAGNFQSPATARAGHRMAEQIDAFLSGIMVADATSKLGVESISKSSPGQAYDLLVELGVRLDKVDCPQAGRFVAVDPDFHGVLLRDDRFIRLDASGSSDGLRNGIVGRAAGFDILKSNKTPSGQRTVTDGATTSADKTVTSATANFTAGDVGSAISGTGIPAGTTIASVTSPTEVELSANATATGAGVTLTIGTAGSRKLVAGIPDATSLAVQITQTEALRAQNRFADVVRGLQVYGGKVFAPDGLAAVTAVIS